MQGSFFRNSHFADTLTDPKAAAMGQKLMSHTPPNEAACADSVTNMGQDESVLILIKHCQDMKQQEARLRLVTLLLLLSCMAVIIFTTSVDIRKHENPGSSGQGGAAEQSPTYLKQEKACPADEPQKSIQSMQIHLRSLRTNNTADRQYVAWDVMFGQQYNKDKRAVVIPKAGFYFIYVRITLNCRGEGRPEAFKRFYLELRKWNEGYNHTIRLTEAWDAIPCASQTPRSLFVGQLFDLWQGDHVNVWIAEGYNLTSRMSFGAYLVHA